MPGPPHGAQIDSELAERLARSERGLRQLIDSVTDAVLLIGVDGQVRLANPAAETLLDRPAAEIAGLHVEELVAPDSRAGHRARREAFAVDPPIGHIAVVQGIAVLRRDGREVPSEVSLSGIETAEGRLMCAVIRDISAQRRQERQDAALRRIATDAGPDLPVEHLIAMVVEEAAALLAAEKALVARFDAGAIVIVGSRGDHHTAVGDVMPTFSGSSLAAVARTGAPARLSYDDLPEGDPIRELALSQDHHHAVAVPITVNTRLWGGLMVAATDPVPDDAAAALTRFAEFAGAMVGAAQARAAERALAEGEERFRLLADFVPQLLWTAGADGDFDFLNRRWVQYTGIPAEEQLGRRWLEQVHPDDRAALMRGWDAAVAQTGPFSAEFRIRRHDGVYRRFDGRGVPMRDESGVVVKWFGSNTDVEEARASSEADRASEAQLRAALDAGRMGAWTIEVEGDILRADANVRTLFEIGDDVPIGGIRDVLRSRMLEEDRAAAARSFARALRGDDADYHAEYRIQLPSGVLRWIESRGRVTRDEDGTPRTVTGVILDVTDARQAGERLLRSQKLEALGTLAGGIAHDFNNLLQVVGGNVAIARADIPDEHGAQEHLGTVERAAQRAADLVDRILSFSRPDDGAGHGAVAMAPLVEEALDLLRPTLPAMIELRFSAGDDLPGVTGDRAGITQVVTNLAANAAQAIGRRPGVIEFRIDAVELTAEEMQRAPELSEGAYVLLTVSDDGPGIDPATLPRIFDPFFTTKGPGEGTGLGLSIVHALMRAHGGAVTVYSVPGTGTAFNLYFPIDGGAAAPAPGDPEAPTRDARPSRILFVDDEPDLVALNERSLGRVGHTVVGHTDPRAALEQFRADPDAFDAVVTDLSMPGLTGLALAREILALRPDIPVLIASGYIPPDERTEAEELGIRQILPKPSPIARLREALEAELGA